MLKKRYRVVLTEGNYPDEKGSMQILIGIYPKYTSAMFIAQKVKDKYKLETLPDIDIVDDSFTVTTTLVDDFLKRKNDDKK
jgi:hypothetical protein